MSKISAGAPDCKNNWSWENKVVVLPERQSITIYTNNYGAGVIRAEWAWDEEHGTFIIIDHAHLPQVIKRFRDIADIAVDRTLPHDMASG